jgi:DNA-binding winged helix-turn-helix (wHTH) protein
VDDEAFVFGSFRLIPAQRLLLDDGKPLRLGSRALEILVALVERAGETIRKDELIARTWPATVVEENALRVHVAALRKALGDGRAGNRFIANVAGRGYAFVASVAREREEKRSAPTPASGAPVGNNLPARLTRVIGRDRIIAELGRQFARRRFLTIVGPGGIGKTTLAIAIAESVEAARGILPRFLRARRSPERVAVPIRMAGHLRPPYRQCAREPRLGIFAVRRH